jgi:hypothetical protein
MRKASIRAGRLQAHVNQQQQQQYAIQTLNALNAMHHQLHKEQPLPAAISQHLLLLSTHTAETTMA